MANWAACTSQVFPKPLVQLIPKDCKLLRTPLVCNNKFDQACTIAPQVVYCHVDLKLEFLVTCLKKPAGSVGRWFQSPAAYVEVPRTAASNSCETSWYRDSRAVRCRVSRASRSSNSWHDRCIAWHLSSQSCNLDRTSVTHEPLFHKAPRTRYFFF